MDKQDKIKEVIFNALYSDQETSELIILKGGQALKIYEFSSRESYDIDFSIKKEKENVFNSLDHKIKKILFEAFDEQGYVLFDYKFSLKPKKRNKEIPPFWGGYKIVFKIISKERKEEIYKSKIPEKSKKSKMQKSASPFGKNMSTKIELEFSYQEYIGKVELMEINDSEVKIKVYRPLIIVYEKMRALCQQIPGTHLPKEKRARVKDIYDIHTVIYSKSQYALTEEDITDPQNLVELVEVFKSKDVPLELLTQLLKTKELLKEDFERNFLNIVPEAEKLGFDYLFGWADELMKSCYSLINKRSEG